MDLPFKFPSTSDEWRCAFTGLVVGVIVGIVIILL